MRRLTIITLKSIGAKLLLFTILLPVVLLGGFGIYMVKTNNSFVQQMMNARGDAMASFMEKIGATYISYYNLAALDTFVKEATQDRNIAFAAFYDDQGKPLTQDLQNFRELKDTDNLLTYNREIKDPDGRLLGFLKLYYSQQSLHENVKKGYMTVIAGVLVTDLALITGIFIFEAVRLLQNARFEMVITDLMMPNVDGFSVLTSAKQANPRTDVLVLTGYPSLDNERRCRALGCTAVLAKPFAVTTIRAKVEECRISHGVENTFD